MSSSSSGKSVMLPEPSLSIDCFMSRISGQIWREEDAFQRDYQGARYRGQLKRAGVLARLLVRVLLKLLTPVKPNRYAVKEDEVYVKHWVDILASHGF